MNHLTGVRLHHAQNGPGQGGFSGAGFSHQTQNLPVADIEGHIMKDLLIGLLPQEAPLPVTAGHMPDRKDQIFAHWGPSFRFRVGMAAMSRLV